MIRQLIPWACFLVTEDHETSYLRSSCTQGRPRLGRDSYYVITHQMDGDLKAELPTRSYLQHPICYWIVGSCVSILFSTSLSMVLHLRHFRGDVHWSGIVGPNLEGWKRTFHNLLCSMTWYPRWWLWWKIKREERQRREGWERDERDEERMG